MNPWLSRIARLAPHPARDVGRGVALTLPRAAKKVDSILVGGCQGFILIPADEYPEFVHGTRLAAYLATGLGLIYGLVFVFFVNDG